MKTGWVLLLTAGALALASVLAVGNAAGVTDPPFLPGSADPETYAHVSFVKDVLPIVQKHCLGCHGGPKPKADFSMDKLTTQDTVAKNRDAWEKVLINVRNGDMPPSSRKRPEQKEIDLLVGWLDATLTKIDTGGKRDPGRVTIRRLNRAEYRNTIRDLLGIDFKGVADFPSDDVGYGFDNIGDVLSLSPIHFEKYLAAARSITDELMKTPALRQKVFETEMAVKGRQARARSILGRFASRAYRRPASEAEINRLLQLVDLAERNGDSFDTGIQLALTAILVSPHFLFKIELDREPNNPDAVHPITEHELATRLSYFLWSSMPDEELFVLAAKGELRKNLQAQVRRMLKDPKAYALVENFAGQWLNLRNLRTAQPDPKLFPSFDESLRAAMQKETELYFHHVLAEDRNILEFLDSDYTFVNERLARHYGIPDVKGVEFRKVKHPSDARGGILTHGSILTLTSNPTRTSPVKRGVWILENILGTPPPVPPPDVPELSEDEAVAASAPLRVRLEQHRPTRTAPSATSASTPSASPSKTSMPSAPGEPRTASSTSTPRVKSSAAKPFGRPPSSAPCSRDATNSSANASPRSC